MNILNSVLVGYLGGSGLLSNAAITARGLVKAMRQAAQGEFHDAATTAVAALAAPSVLAFATTCSVVGEIFGEAYNLVGPTLEEAEDLPRPRLRKRAA